MPRHVFMNARLTRCYSEGRQGTSADTRAVTWCTYGPKCTDAWCAYAVLRCCSCVTYVAASLPSRSYALSSCFNCSSYPSFSTPVLCFCSCSLNSSSFKSSFDFLSLLRSALIGSSQALRSRGAREQFLPFSNVNGRVSLQLNPLISIYSRSFRALV